ncbi:DUF3817 domain-containing protein [soil metagenome]
MSPARLYRLAAVAEAITWTLLLVGMFGKYVTQTTDVGVSIAGALHGFVFLVFCASTVVVAIDQQWSLRRALLGLAAAIPPLATIPFERWAQRRGLLGGQWRLRNEPTQGVAERAVGYAVRQPISATALVLVGVVAVFAGLLVLGPPTELISGG